MSAKHPRRSPARPPPAYSKSPCRSMQPARCSISQQASPPAAKSRLNQPAAASQAGREYAPACLQKAARAEYRTCRKSKAASSKQGRGTPRGCPRVEQVEQDGTLTRPHYFPVRQRIHYIASASSSFRLTHSIPAHGSYLAACFKINKAKKLLSNNPHYLDFHFHHLPLRRPCQQHSCKASSNEAGGGTSGSFRKGECGQWGGTRFGGDKRFVGQ